MSICNYIIKHNTRDMGITHTSQCQTPAFRKNLCKYHYEKFINKQKFWIEREEYREATYEDLISGKSLKYKYTNENKIYIYRGGDYVKIYNSKLNKFIESKMKADFNLYCVKK